MLDYEINEEKYEFEKTLNNIIEEDDSFFEEEPTKIYTFCGDEIDS